MPVAIKSSRMKYKDDNGNYIGVDAVSERTTAEQVAEIESVGDAKVQLIQDKADAVTAQLANAAEVRNMLAGVFDPAVSYVAGQYVIQTVSSVNKLFRFKVDHPAGSWIGTDAVEVKLANDVTDLKSALSETNNDLWNLDEFVYKKYTRNYTNQFNVVQNTAILATNPIIAVNIPVGKEYIFRITGDSVPIREYALYELDAEKNRTNVAEHCYMGTGYTKTATKNIAYFSIYVDSTKAVETDTITISVVATISESDDSIEARVIDLENTSDSNTKDLESIKAEIYNKIDDAPSTTSTGYALKKTPKGSCASTTGYVMKKYPVDEGNLIHIVASADGEVTYQFQKVNSVPTSAANTNLVGDPVSGNIDSYIRVPSGATYLIVSQLSANTTNKVENIRAVNTDILEQIYGIKEKVNPKATTNNYHIATSGLAESRTGYEINKYPVVPGNALYIDMHSAVYQFQNSENVSTQSTSAIVGVTRSQDITNVVIVPDNATWFMVSHATSNTENVVKYIESNRIIDAVPDYYFASGYLFNKINRINQLCKQNALYGDAFLFISDAHWDQNAKQSPKILRYLAENTNIKKLFDGGDTADYGSEEYGKLIANAFDGEIHHVMGNHEYVFTATEADLYYMFDMGKDNQIGKSSRHYYYVDNHQQKIRYIVLSAYKDDPSDPRGETTGYEEEQLEWLTGTALNVESGWGIIIVTHILKSETTDFPTWRAALDNYSGNGEIIMVIEGHTHYDWLGATDGGIPIFASQCDKNQPWISEGVDMEPWLSDRTTGTIKEQCINAVTVNRTTRKINIVRIGVPIRYGMDSSSWTEYEEVEISY